MHAHISRKHRVLICLAAAFLLANAAFAQAQELTLGVALEPPVLDPTVTAAAATDEIVYQNVFEGLTRIDQNGRVQPSLATKWEANARGDKWRFTLRQDVQFHNGVAFTAEHVAFSLRRAQAADSLNAQKRLFESIETVAVVSPFEVRIDLKHPVADFPRVLAWGDAVMVEPTTVDTNDTAPNGTGPYQVQSWRRGEQITLKAVPTAWRQVPIPTVTFLFLADPNAALAALLTGRVDGFPNFPAPEALDLIRAKDTFAITLGTTEGETILALNNARPPFNSRENRCALTRAIDRPTLIELAMFGAGTPIGSHFAPHRDEYVDLSQRQPYAADEVLPTALTAEPVDLVLPPPGYAQRSGELIAIQLRQKGMTVNVQVVSWSDWLRSVFRESQYHMTIVAHTEPDDIEIYAREKYYFNYANSEAQTLLERLHATTDLDQSKQILGEFQTLLADDCVNVFLFQLPKIGVWKRTIKGLWANAPIQANDMTRVAWE